MPKTKTKKNIKVRDLKPSKDAKGGSRFLATPTAKNLAKAEAKNL